MGFIKILKDQIFGRAGDEKITATSAIFTNHALERMKALGLSEEAVMDAFTKGEVEKASYGGKWNAVRKYPGYEIGVNYDRNEDGRYIIVSVWLTGRR